MRALTVAALLGVDEAILAERVRVLIDQGYLEVMDVDVDGDPEYGFTHSLSVLERQRAATFLQRGRWPEVQPVHRARDDQS